MRVSSESAQECAVSANSRCSGVRSVSVQEARHPEHAVHRRADLVAHVRQELGLQARGRQRRIARPLEFALYARPLADVARVEHETADAGLVEEVGPDVLDVTPRAVAVQEAPRERLGHPQACGRRGHELACARRVVGVHELEERRSDDNGRLVAEEPLDRGAHVAHGRVGLEHDDEIRGVPDERDESFFCPACGLLRPVPFSNGGNLTEDGEPRERDRAENEAAEGLDPDVSNDANQQAVADHEGGVRHQAEGRRLVRRGRRVARGAAAEVLCAGDDEDVASDPHRAQPSAVARRTIEAQIAVDQVTDEEGEEADGDQRECTTARLLGPSQQDRHAAEQKDQVANRVRNRDRDVAQTARRVESERAQHEVPHDHRPAQHHGARVEPESRPLRGGTGGNGEREQAPQHGRVDEEVDEVGHADPRLGAENPRVVDDQTADRPVQEQGERDESPRAAGLLVQIRARRRHPAENGGGQVQGNEGDFGDEPLLRVEPSHHRPDQIDEKIPARGERDCPARAADSPGERPERPEGHETLTRHRITAAMTICLRGALLPPEASTPPPYRRDRRGA